jgi:hypothetical protein
MKRMREAACHQVLLPKGRVAFPVLTTGASCRARPVERCSKKMNLAATRRANQCIVVQPLEKKYSGFPKTQITAIYTASRPTQRGVSRSSRTLERDAVDAKVSLTNGTDADGEVVWS